ncbi:hypothetical protein EJ377_02015 [Chryseobacterium arthrosphaerae]|uniref:Uncharacterized protein n=1 Tax=Chryseobacterium arthrosphaerae TaxID=651561 RepID=A0A432DYZ9_9FLAO|nr:hypothetical protein EJ377_02015 [Chryseobacterium arthrosphaerae]
MVESGTERHQLSGTAVFDTMILAKNFEKGSSTSVKANVQDRMINQLSNEQMARLCLAILRNKELKSIWKPV